MEKLYFKQLNEDQEQLRPKVETIAFLLNYSKSLGVVKDKKNRSILFHLN